VAVDIWWYESRGQWCADVPTGDGRKRLYLGPNKQEARAELHRHMAKYYDGLEGKEPDSRARTKGGGESIPLVELAVRFLDWNKANRAHGTWRNYRDGLKHVTKPYKDKLATELSPTDIEDIKQEMVSDGYRARTINIMITAVKRLYNWAVKQEFLEENPLDGVERVSEHVNAPDRPEDKYLSWEKARDCIEICRQSPPLGQMCEFMLLTGMRVGEVVRLAWADIDLDEKFIRLERHKTSGHTNRPRTIPLCKRAIEIISDQSHDGMEPDETVFRGDNGQTFTVSALHCRLKRLRKKHPELKDFSFHKLRHTCATYLARQKVPERVAQAILGHSSTLITRYYTATDPDEMVDAVEKLSEGANTGES